MRTSRLAASALLAVTTLALAAGTSAAAPAARPHAASKTAACSAAHTKLTVQNVSRPINHQLLTLTNTGSTKCDAVAHPYLGFDNDQSVTSVVEDSKPQAVVTLAPGESAHAGIALSAADGSAGHGRWARTLRVGLDGGSGPAGEVVNVPLPAGTWIDDSAAVTYWQADPADALVW
ncbi:DUF4232 domain-containing protein [Streptomyces mobaraensis NBRC 13819 = DSM 40847]|uniref:DUF4232 domain-containing protein n=1 Tax=Streptomyces mobaraensis (strain ATCC 29032 / DSM 40847 / JCM 4168 / NBRC 13819 / NCIMB 11159 / IPCR 16-22) TaxID=1223523 RepID=M3AZH5_STRM1|nr:DUF4232 domain-containing protein [Streptomyces mobaraensis]EME99072.1 hypothetical protein H340_18219 [Streptomyces mobaraensis NBRC 13819 = DSM 40847]QTT74606.1 DUF4232 domain-containing protein [Streptomyces mobaraensis NBRC 13819 = DSM 40847]